MASGDKAGYYAGVIGGPIYNLIDDGKIPPLAESISLGDIVRGSAQGRRNDEENIVFVACGMAVFDVSWGYDVYRNALKNGVGTNMPPSVLMIMYCIAVGKTSIAGLFLTAVVPALLIAVGQMVVANRISAKRNYASFPPVSPAVRNRAIIKAIPALFLPVIILGGIFGGVFTITEASAVAVLYSGFLAIVVNRAIKPKDIPQIFLECALTSGLVLILAGGGSVMAWAIANERVLSHIIEPMSQIPPWLFLLLVNILLLIVGCFMDDYASVVILAPIIAPVAWALGIDPLHIAAVICINLVVGLATPPFGITLFVCSPITKVKIEETVKESLPFLAVTIGVLLLITFVPSICLWLPRTFGYV